MQASQFHLRWCVRWWVYAAACVLGLHAAFCSLSRGHALAPYLYLYLSPYLGPGRDHDSGLFPCPYPAHSDRVGSVSVVCLCPVRVRGLCRGHDLCYDHACRGPWGGQSGGHGGRHRSVKVLRALWRTAQSATASLVQTGSFHAYFSSGYTQAKASGSVVPALVVEETKVDFLCLSE